MRRIDFEVWRDGGVNVKLFIKGLDGRWKLLGDPTHHVKIAWRFALEMFDLSRFTLVNVRVR